MGLLIALILAILILIFFICYVHKISRTNLELNKIKKYWGNLEIDINKYSFFFSKSTSYRRLFLFYTTFSYGLRIIAIILTLVLTYSVIEKIRFTNVILVISSSCDAISLLFPFQKYIDTFSVCSVKMEEAILKNTLLDDEKEIVENFNKAYIWCEEYIHMEQKI